MLKLQSADGRINANGTRHVRQAILTGEIVQRADVLAVINELVMARMVLDRLEVAHARVTGVLATLERDALVAKADAYSEGWHDGTEAMVRGRSPEERILGLLDAQGSEENPYLAQLDAPVVEDVPGGISGEVPC